jgi:hypothetical protein
MLEGITCVLAPGESRIGGSNCFRAAAFCGALSEKFGSTSKKRSRNLWRPACPGKKAAAASRRELGEQLNPLWANLTHAASPTTQSPGFVKEVLVLSTEHQGDTSRRRQL